MGTFVTLAEVLEARGAPLEEEEVWSVLKGTTELLIDTTCKGPMSMCSLISPSSLLLASNGSLGFKSCPWSEDLSSFTAPEMLPSSRVTNSPAAEKMVIYSLGMTLYWSVDYHLPQNQPIHLSDELNSLLLCMCEDLPHQRTDLLTVLDACKKHRKEDSSLPTELIVKNMVELVFRHTAGKVSPSENVSQLSERSQKIRERLQGNAYSGSASGSGVTTGTLTKQAGSIQQQSHVHKSQSSPTAVYHSAPNSPGLQHMPYHGSRDSCSRVGSPFLDVPRHGNPGHAHLEGYVHPGPEFIQMLEKPQITLELPGSIVLQKGKAGVTHRDVTVVMPSGLNVLVKCDIKSKVGEIFDLVVAHANLMEHSYFALASVEDNEFFFLDNDTKLSKVIPDSGRKAPSGKHKLTRQQYYLQLRKDILEDRLRCNEEMGVFLAALALQTEFGDYSPEVCGRNYYQPEQYVSKSLLEKMALPCLKEEVARQHAGLVKVTAEEAELEFLKTVLQLPEYGVLFHHMNKEKRYGSGELLFGVCTKGILVCEAKSRKQTPMLRLQWAETNNLSTTRHKLNINSSNGGKGHVFLMDSSKMAKYLLNLCSAQYKFHNEMNSRRVTKSLVFDENVIQYSSLCQAQRNHLQRLCCSEIVLNQAHTDKLPSDSTSKSCEDLPTHTEILEIEDTMEQLNDKNPQEEPQNWCGSGTVCPGESTMSVENHDSDCHIASSDLKVQKPIIVTTAQREIICLSLKKDPKLGLGIVIMGEDRTRDLDLGIFIASVVPNGPADRDGRIRPGGRLISLNNTSLEGVTFNAVADVLQNSPDEVKLIVSQAKDALSQSNMSLVTCFGSQATLTGLYEPSTETLGEIFSAMMIPRSRNSLCLPFIQSVNAQRSCSRSSSVVSLRPEKTLFVKLKKINGSLGISVGTRQKDRILICSIIPGGAAEQDGRLQIGDRLVEVDGYRLIGATYQQVVERLTKTGEVVSLLMAREGSDLSKSASTEVCRDSATPESTTSAVTKDYSFVTEENTQAVCLKKNSSGLGFSFLISDPEPSEGGSNIVRVKRLFPGQPAERSGLIRVGDVILAVNGEPLKGLSFQRIVNLLQQAPPKVTLTLCRPVPESNSH